VNLTRALVVVIVVLPAVAVSVVAVVDVVRRRSLGVGAKVGWLAGLVLVPGVAALVYLASRPSIDEPLEGFGDAGPEASGRLDALMVAVERRRRGELDAAGFEAAVAELGVGAPPDPL